MAACVRLFLFSPTLPSCLTTVITAPPRRRTAAVRRAMMTVARPRGMTTVPHPARLTTIAEEAAMTIDAWTGQGKGGRGAHSSTDACDALLSVCC